MQQRAFDVRMEPVGDLREHAGIGSSFEARSCFEVHDAGGTFELEERSIAAPYRKNYDDFEHPTMWPLAFDTMNWILVSAFAGADRIGGAVVAVGAPGVDMLEGRADLAVLWDLRVAPAHRRRSVATALLRAAQTWAWRVGCTELKVETQNTNPAACKFYMRHGFVLTQARPGAYPELPQDVQLIWRKQLHGDADRETSGIMSTDRCSPTPGSNRGCRS